MEGIPANYLGRLVSKEHFRAFIYATDGRKRVVESWDEYESCMQTGVWFATKEDAMPPVSQEIAVGEYHPKSRAKSKRS